MIKNLSNNKIAISIVFSTAIILLSALISPSGSEGASAQSASNPCVEESGDHRDSKPRTGGSGSSYIDKEDLRSRLTEKLKTSKLNGYVPSDGAKFGITTGSPTEWANYLTELAGAESSYNNGSVGDIGRFSGNSNGLFQLSPDDALGYGLNGGKPFTLEQLRDPDINMSAAISINEAKVIKYNSIKNGAGQYWGPIQKGWLPYVPGGAGCSQNDSTAQSNAPCPPKPQTAQAQPTATQGTGEASPIQNPIFTSYWPVKGGGTQSMEGGWVTSRKGLNGQNTPSTLEMVRTGESNFVTIAADPSHYGETYVIPKISYVNNQGEQHTLYNVKAYVHDTGGAFRVTDADNAATRDRKLRKFDIAYDSSSGDAEAARLDGKQPSKKDVQFIPADGTAVNTTSDSGAEDDPCWCKTNPQEKADCENQTQAASSITPNYGGAPLWQTSPNCFKHMGNPGGPMVYYLTFTCNSGIKIDGRHTRYVADCGVNNSVGCSDWLSRLSGTAGCLWSMCKGNNAIWDPGTKRCGCDDGRSLRTASVPRATVPSGSDQSLEQENPIGDTPQSIPPGEKTNLSAVEEQKDSITKDNTSVLIDKSDKTMIVYKDGQEIARTNINVGVNDTAGTLAGGINGDKITPTGTFTIINTKQDSNGVYSSEGGAYMGTAFSGLSAVDQNGNIRGIGIHGGNLDSGGTLHVTNGCIRVTNSDADVFSGLPVGTKVTIQN